jgi:peptidoglycan/xylan/chitin deacetylase (PgdA/CDA1 family)
MFKHTIPALFPLITPSLTWKVDTTDKVLYLTFDDGPHPTITPQVLTLLSNFQAKATFFCVGDNVAKYPETFNQVIQQGHAVGNHTYHHVKGWSTSVDDYVSNTQQAHDLIGSNLFRPPYGRITRAQMQALKNDYQIVMWSILTRDYDKHIDVAKTAERLCKLITPGDIIVFHDSEKAAPQLFPMLERVLQYFSNQGYQFDKL